MAILQATQFTGSVDIDTLRLDGESLTKADLQSFKEVDTRITASAGNQIIGTNTDINTTGATIIDNLYMTDGVITSHGTRVLTLANLGYTGATNANYITNNNQLTNGSGYQTSTQVNTAIQNVVDAAPAALDTLNELAASLNDDSDFAGTMTTALAGKQAVGSYFTDGDTVLNMTNNDGLVYDDTTNKMYVKLDGTNREIFHTGNLTVITNNNQLTNGAGYITSYTDTNTQLTDAQVRSKFSAGTNVSISAAGVISSTDTNTNTQLTDAQVRSKLSGAGSVSYNSSTGVFTGTDTNTQLTDAQVRSKFSAGTNVSISATGVISSTDTNTDTNTTYTAGTGLTLTGTVFSNDITNNNQLTNGANYLTTSGKAADSNLLDGINSTSFLRSDTNDSFSGTLTSTARNNGIFGTYDSTKTDHIWSMGTAYKNSSTGTDFGNLYGLAYKHTNNTTGGTMAGGHQMVWASNGTPKSAMGDGIWTAGTVTATGGNSGNWNTAYGWGNHASAGYLTSYTDTNTQLTDAQVRSKFSAGTNVSISAAGVISSTDTNTVYTHPTHPGDDINVDTGALTGATVISDLDFNITTDTNGHVTDANGTVNTRTLTLANLGYTGATNATSCTGTVTGTGSNNRIATFTSTTGIIGESGLTYDGATLTVASKLLVGANNTNNGYCSSVLGGLYNSNAQSYSTIAGGYQNTFTSATTSQGYNFIGAGACNNITSGLWSGITSGCNNKIIPNTTTHNCKGNFIGGGSNNNICDTEFTSILGGFSNSLGKCSNCSNVNGGTYNTIGSHSSVIGGGGCNTIVSQASPFSIIGGGQLNSICATSTWDSILGGCNNSIVGSSTAANSIAGGRSNAICNNYSSYNFIGGGTANCIASSYGGGNAIIGGSYNKICTNNYSAIIGGSNIIAYAANYVYVPNLCNVNGGTSDCRLKESICTLPYGLSQVSQLEPVSYKFKSDESKATKYGFLAQCVQEIMPGLITNHPTDLVDGTPVLQFDKEAIWSSMVNAIKDLKNEVDALKARIDVLEA